jgi:hypothetical protein
MGSETVLGHEKMKESERGEGGLHYGELNCVTFKKAVLAFKKTLHTTITNATFE